MDRRQAINIHATQYSLTIYILKKYELVKGRDDEMNFNESLIHGSIELGFEKVKDAFINNFRKGVEVGAAYAVYKIDK